MINKQQTERVLRRLLKGGVIRRIPKNQKDTEVFLALVASVFDPGTVYSETEVNEQLQEWMEDITCPSTMDYVTLRRYMVDYSFLLRDPSGSTYRTNQTVINSVIEPEARSIQPRSILEEVQHEKAQRKLTISQ